MYISTYIPICLYIHFGFNYIALQIEYGIRANDQRLRPEMPKVDAGDDSKLHTYHTYVHCTYENPLINK